MFAQKFRLKQKAIDPGFRPKRYHSPNLTLLVSPSNSGFKLRVVVSKKVDKRAVFRNLIRRQLHHLLKQYLSNSPDCPYQLIIIVKPTAAKQTFDQLSQEIEQLLVQIPQCVVLV